MSNNLIHSNRHSRLSGRGIRRSLALVAALVVCAVAASAASAHANGDSIWTPGACKADLVKYGVETGDGRTFRALSARDVFCVGQPYCEFKRANGAFYYDHFVVLMVDRNFVYRTMVMHVISDDYYELTELRTHGRVDSVGELARFRANARGVARAAAVDAQQDCLVV